MSLFSISKFSSLILESSLLIQYLVQLAEESKVCLKLCKYKSEKVSINDNILLIACCRVSRIILAIVVLAAFIGYILFETYEDFARLRALGGIALFVCIGLAISGKFTINF